MFGQFGQFGQPDYDEDYPELKQEITGLDIFMMIALITGVAIFALPYVIAVIPAISAISE